MELSTRQLRTLPSLYDTIKLAKIVKEVTLRLKIALCERRRQDKCLEEGIYSAIKRNTNPRRSHRKSLPPGQYSQGQFQADLDRLNLNSSLGRLSEVAADDRLFIAAASMLPHASTDIVHGAAEIQNCRNVLERLRCWRKAASLQIAEVERPSSFPDFMDEKIIANLEHLILLRLNVLLGSLVRQFLLFHCLVSDFLRRFRSSFGLGWFFEWPDGRRPLSSTWPWNIKPSLVVLWGVCWMFVNYDDDVPDIDTSGSVPIPTILSDPAFWEVFNNRKVSSAPDESQAALPGQDMEEYSAAGNFIPMIWPDSVNDANETIERRHQVSHPSWSSSYPASHVGILSHVTHTDQAAGYEFVGHYPPRESIYTQAGPDVPSLPPHGLSSLTYPLQSSGSHPSFPGYAPHWHETSSPQRVTRQEHFRDTPRITIQPPLSISHSPQISSSHHSAASEYSNDGSLHSMHSSSIYPMSPASDSASPMGKLAGPTDSPTVPISSPPGHRRLSVKKDRSVEKNENGLYPCDQIDCVATFSRKCEWSKHMDKHDRPYSCKEPGCEKLQGFTYSGGLLRHEREVHKKHGGPKEALMCPHSNCKRSSGTGFTRRENLHEHLRRVHKEGDDKRHESVEDGDEQSEGQSEGFTRKRKRSTASDRSNSVPAIDEVDGLRTENKRLKKENEELHARLLRFEEAIGNLMPQRS